MQPPFTTYRLDLKFEPEKADLGRSFESGGKEPGYFGGLGPSPPPDALILSVA